MGNVPKYMRAFNWAWSAGYKAGVAAGTFKANQRRKK